VTPPPAAQTPPPATPKPSQPGDSASDSLTALPIETGVLLSWTPFGGALGYRVYRSAEKGVEGISITDFAIAATEYVDVNVDADTTYYYVARALLKEADVWGNSEELGPASIEVSAKTAPNITGGNASDLEDMKKNVILMKLYDPMMSVNGNIGEVDPANPGTTPVELNGRTLMPIRSVIEAMDGTVEWEEELNRVTLNAGGHTVVMVLEDKNFTVDGEAKTMDIAPSTINDRTMVPVRFVAENAGCVVDWIESSMQIVVVFFT
jgi:hypothetical protein